MPVPKTAPARVFFVCAAFGAIMFMRLVLLSGVSVLVFGLMLGLCLAWVGQATAALLLLLTAVERLRKRTVSAITSPVVWLALGLVGVGLALVGAVRITEVKDADTAGLIVVGLLVAGLAWQRRNRTRTSSGTFLLLVVTIALFQVPRESGVFSLRWNNAKRVSSTSATSSENCSGTNLGDRPASIVAHRPAWVIRSELQGSFGQLVNRRLGSVDLEEFAPNTAIATLRGQLEYGDLFCYLPAFKSEVFEGTVTIDLSLIHSNNLNGPSLSCTATHTFTFAVNATSFGVGSCLDLASASAAEVAGGIVQRLNQATGHN